MKTHRTTIDLSLILYRRADKVIKRINKEAGYRHVTLADAVREGLMSWITTKEEQCK